MIRFRQLASVVAGSALIAASVAASTPAAARPAGSPETITFLNSGNVTVTTSTGKHLTLNVSANRFAHNSGASDAGRPGTMTVSLTGNKGHESHQWSFNVSGGSFTNTKLATGAQIAPFGAVSLAIAANGTPHTKICDADNHELVGHVTLKGTIRFKTKAGAWGNIHRTLTFAHGTLTGGHGDDVEESCSSIPCQAGATWVASHGDVSFNGTYLAAAGHQPVSRIVANRSVTFTSPAHAMRFDMLTVKAPPPNFVVTAGTTTLHVKSLGGIATGTATMTSSHRSAYDQGCATGEERGHSWNAHYVAGTKPLTFHEKVFGPLTISTDHAAFFDEFSIH
jgi:hypothetical protein